jgi:hypothetical protein
VFFGGIWDSMQRALGGSKNLEAKNDSKAKPEENQMHGHKKND